MTTTTIENRSYPLSGRLPKIERRAKEGGGETRVLVGYAAVYYRAGDPGTEFKIFDDMVERILPGAFDAAVRDQDDAIGTYNHRTMLGRVSSGTARMFADSIGLRFEIDLPDTQAGRDLDTHVERGDVVGSSFGFTVFGKRGRYSWATEARDGKPIEVRQIEEVELIDFGPVDRPAYEGTSAAFRSVDRSSLERERDAFRSKRPASDDDDRFRLFVDASVAAIALR